jgi:hypothetical protein
MDKVLIYHRGLDRTVAVPAAVAPAWCADGWQLAPETGPKTEVIANAHVSAEEELAAANAAQAEAVDTAKKTIKEKKS